MHPAHLRMRLVRLRFPRCQYKGTKFPLAYSWNDPKLYSPYPFPYRIDRMRDAFGLQAWDHLQQNTDSAFARTDIQKGHYFLRVAFAEKITNEACMGCHSAHSDFPKSKTESGSDVLQYVSRKASASTPSTVSELKNELELF